jgi:hypothetical protein
MPARWTETEYWSTPMSRRASGVATIAVLIMFSLLVFARLGTYALWDDEAQTALFGQAVWATGDTSARHGHNTVLYRDAVEIDSQLRNRLVAPLPYYLEAPFVRDTQSAWWARLPFALAGVAVVGALLAWLRATGASRRVWALSIMALVGSVALVLYARQARYYTVAMLGCVIATYAYTQRARGRPALVTLAIAGAVTCATHYLAYAALASALAVDYVWIGRKEARLSLRALAALTLSQVVLCAPVVLTWYPLGKDLARQHATFDAGERFMLWLRTLRDLNHSEYAAGLVMLAAPIAYLRVRDMRLLRLLVAILVSTVVVTLFTPQPPASPIADIRYVAFLLPGCLALCVLVIDAVPLRGLLPLGLGVVAFGTTFLHVALARVVPSGGTKVPLRSTLVSYARELAHPPVSAYELVAEWLAANARPGDSVLAGPDYAAYPLMFHVPQLVYGWQLSSTRAAELPPLDPIQLRGRIAPDWVVMFERGDHDPSGARAMRALGARYVLAGYVPATGVDLSRPELLYHRFDAEDAYTPDAPITIWRRAQAAPP